MSWLQDLYQTYEENLPAVGQVQRSIYGKEVVLLPVSHAYQNAQVEVVVDEDGNFYDAWVIPKEQAPTMIPVTIASGGRTSAPVPHGLHDGLQYLAGDFEKYGGKYKKANAYELYMEQLKAWALDDPENQALQSIKNYLQKGRLIEDLLNPEKPVLFAIANQLVPKWKKEFELEYGEKPPIFSVLSGEQTTAFIRFSIHKKIQGNCQLWGDKEMIDSFIRFYEKRLPETGLDYVTGKQLPITENHPSKIRYGGDMAKLISGNDTTNFTFRGRFSTSNQVATLSYEVSQKSHNALKWLIAKQGYSLDGRVFLTWGIEGIPPVQASTIEMMAQFDQLFGSDTEAQQLSVADTTEQGFSRQFHQALRGLKAKLQTQVPIKIMILDAATPGRMSILYYQVIEPQLYFKHLEKWHKTCYWRQTYKNQADATTNFYGTPSLSEIARAVHGGNASDTVIKNTIQKLFPCVIGNQKIPHYIERTLIQRASNPVSMEYWEWQKTLNIACAVINHQYSFSKEEATVALDKNQTDRSYLFGRLLAVADVLEGKALYNKSKKDNVEKQQDKRITNARRYMNAFSRHPEKTWKIIYENLLPYQTRLKDNGYSYQCLIEEISTQFKVEDFNNQALTGLYLLGYNSQCYELRNNKEKKQTEKTEA